MRRSAERITPQPGACDEPSPAIRTVGKWMAGEVAGGCVGGGGSGTPVAGGGGGGSRGAGSTAPFAPPPQLHCNRQQASRQALHLGGMGLPPREKARPAWSAVEGRHE